MASSPALSPISSTASGVVENRYTLGRSTKAAKWTQRFSARRSRQQVRWSWGDGSSTSSTGHTDGTTTWDTELSTQRSRRYLSSRTAHPTPSGSPPGSLSSPTVFPRPSSRDRKSAGQGEGGKLGVG